MADTKISALTALTGAGVDATTDVLPIVDTSVTTTKKILVSELGKALNVLMTEQASTSGSSVNFTSIPAGVKSIDIMFVGVSTNGSADLLIQIGDAGGLEVNGYLGGYFALSAGGVSAANATTGFGVFVNTSSDVLHGTISLRLENSGAFTWTASGVIANSASAIGNVTSGSKSLSAELDRLSIVTTDTFDAGAINVQYGW